MRPPEPTRSHAPAIYQAIILEHDGSAERLGGRLQQLGWSLVDAAWAVAQWPLASLAAAIVHECEARGLSPTVLPFVPKMKPRSTDSEES